MAIWTPPQLAAFLQATRGDRLRALWWLIALRGLRRGEAVALQWTDLDLEARGADICRARTSAGYLVHEGPPKTAAGVRTMALDKRTAAGAATATNAPNRPPPTPPAGPTTSSGYVFTRPDTASGRGTSGRLVHRRMSSTSSLVGW
jgi:integrase